MPLRFFFQMRARRFLLLFLCLPPAACSWFSTELTVSLCLPEPPDHWLKAFPDLGYELLLSGMEAMPESSPWPADGKLSIPKEPNWPVLAVPVTRNGRLRLPPAGAVCPLNLSAEGQELALSWEGGPLAATLLALRREHVDVSALNTTRLEVEMRDRSGGDPWRLDLAHLAEKLASGEFRVTDIRSLPFRSLLLPVPAGTWFLESPFRLPQVTAEGEALPLVDVPFGAHRLFRGDGLADYVLYVGSEGEEIVGEP